MQTPSEHVLWFENLGRGDVARVGGKNASLGEMVQTLGSQGVRVPAGFATSADAYWHYIDANGLKATTIQLLAELDAGRATLAETGTAIRRAVLRGEWPEDTAKAIREVLPGAVPAGGPRRSRRCRSLQRDR